MTKNSFQQKKTLNSIVITSLCLAQSISISAFLEKNIQFVGLKYWLV